MNYKTPLLCFTCLAVLELTAGCVVYGISPVYSAAGMASGWALTFRQCRLSYVFWGTVALLLLTCVVGAGFENIPWLNNLLNQAVRIIGG